MRTSKSPRNTSAKATTQIRFRKSHEGHLRFVTGSAVILPLAASIATVLSLSVSAPSQAATVTFTGPGTTWNSGADWSSTLTPQLTDDLLFNSPFATSLDASFSVQTLSFNTGSGSVSIDANASGTNGQTLTLNGDGGGNDVTDGLEDIAVSKLRAEGAGKRSFPHVGKMADSGG